VKHFPATDWIDFARHTMERGKTIDMQRHLEEGCAKCLKNLEMWRLVVDFANKEEGYQPPESSVRIARAGFALRNVTPFPTGPLEVASLVFDSFEPALVAGIRGQSASPRQLLFKSGTVCIDLRVQPTPGSDAVVLLGQLLDSARPTQGLSDILVSLLSEGTTISNKKTNDFGEFDFGFGLLRNKQLMFGLEDSRTLVVPVPDANMDAGFHLT
jgi:hypothetical protein